MYTIGIHKSYLDILLMKIVYNFVSVIIKNMFIFIKKLYHANEQNYEHLAPAQCKYSYIPNTICYITIIIIMSSFSAKKLLYAKFLFFSGETFW